MSESPSLDTKKSRGLVLVVDDEPAICRLFSRVLGTAGYEAVTAQGGAEATKAVANTRFDAIVSDISMPGMDGLQLLRTVRGTDFDVPVILITGDPTLDTAIRAVEYGALRYLSKPIEPAALVEVVEQACRLSRLARIKREAMALFHPDASQAADVAGLENSFESALKSLWLACQPIVCWSSRNIFAYEALLRSKEPALPHPPAVIDAATRLERLNDLGRTVRNRAADLLPSLPAPCHLFVNLHPLDLSDDHLYHPDAPLSKVASRVVLEITERARLDGIRDLKERIDALRTMGFRIAVDDLGAGYAGLSSFAQLSPEVVKVDMSLVRDVHLSETKSRLIRSLCALSEEMRVLLIAEGVETAQERDCLLSIGCDLLQGYFFARPERPFTAITPQAMIP
jgi:EAL domain-containing protein (putative c-di-GMP-specific phosphodiesterase class I)/CheY-like chemotaxis protein